MGPWIFFGLLALAVAGGGKKGAGKVTQGVAKLKAGKAYRIEADVSGAALATNPTAVAQAVQAQLNASGVTDVLVQPSIPIRVSYTVLAQVAMPVALNAPATQTFGNVSAEITFRSVQQLG